MPHYLMKSTRSQPECTVPIVTHATLPDEVNKESTGVYCPYIVTHVTLPDQVRQGVNRSVLSLYSHTCHIT